VRQTGNNYTTDGQQCIGLQAPAAAVETAFNNRHDAYIKHGYLKIINYTR